MLFKIFSGLAQGLSEAQLAPFISNMHTALWVLAATSLVGAGVSLLRPRHAGGAALQPQRRARARPDSTPRPVPEEARS